MAMLATAVPAHSDDVVQIPRGHEAKIDRHGTCRIVRNNSAHPIAVPVRRSSEWNTGGNSFLPNIGAMPGISARNCAPPRSPVPSNANVAMFWPAHNSGSCRYQGAGEWRRKDRPPVWARPMSNQHYGPKIPIDGACIVNNGRSLEQESAGRYIPAYMEGSNFANQRPRAQALSYPTNRKTCYVYLVSDGPCKIFGIVSEQELSGLKAGSNW